MRDKTKPVARMRCWGLLALAGLAGCAGPSAPARAPASSTDDAAKTSAAAAVERTSTVEPHPELRERSLAELQADMAAGERSAVAIVEAYLERIAALDRGVGKLHSVLALNPAAVEDAARLDAERAAEGSRGPLHGVPIVIKDNIETRELPTTAGSLALAGNHSQRDAPIVARLREAGAVILAKANLSEWANIRSARSTSGWSAVGGLTRNPYALDRNPCGSSSGSAVAVAANLAAVAIGTETDGSIVCPAATNGVVGLKPTVGLVSRTHIVPISASQDSAGPMGRSVADVALVLGVIAGSDPTDPATAEADAHARDYAANLDEASLDGVRVGVLRFLTGDLPILDATFDEALAELEAAGAELVEIDAPPHDESMSEDELTVMLAEFRAGLAEYLAATPASVEVRSLADLVAFNRAHAELEMPLFGQDWFLRALDGPRVDDPAYLRARADNLRRAREQGIDRMVEDHELALLVAPTQGPGWTTDVINGDHALGGSSQWAAVAGYPHLTVPMGFVHGLPVGLSFMGPAWSEARLLEAGHVFERRRQARRPPRYLPSVDSDPAIEGALEPAPWP